jgi:hypothetical protein
LKRRGNFIHSVRPGLPLYESQTKMLQEKKMKRAKVRIWLMFFLYRYEYGTLKADEVILRWGLGYAGK